MANRKITDMTALTAPANDDLLAIVDISESAATDKNKKVTVQELFSNARALLGIDEYANDSAAGTGGLSSGELYYNTTSSSYVLKS